MNDLIEAWIFLGSLFLYFVAMVTSDPEQRDNDFLASYCQFHFWQEEMTADLSLDWNVHFDTQNLTGPGVKYWKLHGCNLMDLIVLYDNQTMAYSVVKRWIVHSHNLIDVDLEKGLTVHSD